MRPAVLTIAGSDPSGGAGIQADLKTFTVHGCYGMSVLTALTVQNTLGVSGVHAVPPEFVGAQLEAVLEDVGCDAAKTGMLASAEIVRAVVRELQRRPVLALVVDPVMVSKSGHRLLQADAVAALRDELFPLAALVTPNLEEVGDLLGRRPTTVPEMEEAAVAMAALGPRAVLVKGGHLGDSVSSPDVLWADGVLTRLEAPRLANSHTHGTGCTLSAAIAARMAQGMSTEEAVMAAKEYLTEAIRHAWPLGHGVGPVDHLWQHEQETTGRRGGSSG